VVTRAGHRERHDILKRLSTLTRRERQVLDLVATGMLNKQIAAALGAAEKTIKVHRGRIMEKMQVRTAVALVGLLFRVERAHVPRDVQLNPISCTPQSHLEYGDHSQPGHSQPEYSGP
jgi:DNA-binding CsgD family transcriptional regulator